MRYLLVLLIFYVSSVTLFADENEAKNPFDLSLDFWYTTAYTNRIWSDEHHQGEAEGVPFRFSDIGVNNSTFVPAFTARFYPSDYDHLDLNIWSAQFTGKGTVKKDFAYDGNSFSRGDTVDSQFGLEHFRLTYRRDIFKADWARTELWMGFGFARMAYDNTIDPVVSAQTVAATEHLLGLFTLVGIGTEKRLGDHMNLTIDGWLNLVGGQSRGAGIYFDQKYVSIEIAVDYTVSNALEINFGYKFLDFSLRSREHGEFVENSEQDLEQICMGGPIFGLRLSF